MTCISAFRWIAPLVAMASVALASSASAQSSSPSNPDSVVTQYCAAWGTPSREARDTLLARVWAEDGVYSDPGPTLAKGRRALSDTIEGFHRSSPGSRFGCSAVQAHHGMFRFSWTIASANSTQVMQGMDFGEFAPDGRIRRIVGFFGPPPAVKP